MKYINSLREAIESLIRDHNTYVLGEDIIDPYGGAFKVTKGLSTKYPLNILSMPMSEQGFTAMGIGMALMGENVIVEIMFGDFITLVADQLINHAAKFYELYGQNLKFILRTPSGGYRGYGATHSQSLEKIFLGIPGLKIVAANRYIDVGNLLKKSLLMGIPTLFIENKVDYSKELILNDFDIYEREEESEIVKYCIEGEKPEYTLICYGGIADFVLSATKKLLYSEEIICDVIIIANLSDIKNNNTILNMIKTKKVVIVEEATGGYGFSSQLCVELLDKVECIKVCNSKNNVIPSGEKGEYEVLLQEEDIVQFIVTL